MNRFQNPLSLFVSQRSFFLLCPSPGPDKRRSRVSIQNTVGIVW